MTHEQHWVEKETDSLTSQPVGVFERWRRSLITTTEILLQHEELTPIQLRDAILDDQDGKWRQGVPIFADEYFERFSALKGLVGIQAEIVFNEYVLRMELESPYPS